MSGFLDILPTYLEQVSISNPMTGEVVHDEAGAVFSLRDGVIELRNALTNASDGFVQTVSIVFGGFVSFVLIIIFSFYFSVQDKGIDDFLRLVVPAKYTNKVLDLWKRSQKKIGLWMQGQLLLGLIVGVLTYLGLTVLGVRYSLLFAIIAGLLEIIPLFGPVLASIPAIALAFVDGGPSLGFLVIGLYLIIQQFENHLIHPLVVSKVVGVPPILIILSLLVGGHLAGFLGIILAVPLAAVLQELVAEISRERASLNSAPKSA
jgi:predicted PurR-regulated permease PerM